MKLFSPFNILFLVLVGVSVALVMLMLKPPKTVYLKDDVKYTALLERVKLDSVSRDVQFKKVVDLQSRIDSLTALSERVKEMPIAKLDSVAHVKSVRKDSLICTDEKTYRSLVISSLNFGEQKYTLCLGQIQHKDSIIASFQSETKYTISDIHTFQDDKWDVDLKLASMKRSRYNWMLVGLATGIGVSLLTVYLVK